ncbi:hypothetical protein [Natrinema sp. 74]|uniref:hypothetical protein n=1 Tax=Natrinema sp. 74 TaxID=3384159 RepID=UPI0038D49388
MYAASFIETLRAVDDALERALSLETYSRTETVRRIRAQAVAAIDDVAELSTVAVTNVELAGYERRDADDAVESIVRARIADGDDAEPPAESVDRALGAGRIVEVEPGTIRVPLTDKSRWLRNWWLLAAELSEWLAELIDGYRRIHRRASIDGSDAVETAFWTLLERLLALRDLFEQGLTIGRFVYRTTRRETFDLLEDVGRIAMSMTERNHA